MKATCLSLSSPFHLHKSPYFSHPPPQKSKQTTQIDCTMGNKGALLLLLLVMCHGVLATMADKGVSDGEGEDLKPKKEGREEEEEMGRSEDWFLLQDSKQVVKSDAGEIRVVKSRGRRIIDRPMHIGFITMEPRSLFVPQYLDSSLIIFVRRGEAKVGLIYRDELAERQLKMGDIYRIPAGSSFYLVNKGEGQRLHIVCSIDPSESLGIGVFQSFFIAGGNYPGSVLAGFEPETLSTAFNVTKSELKELLTGQQEDPIVYIDDNAPRTSVWASFLKMKKQNKLRYLKKIVRLRQEPVEEEKNTWSWRKLLGSVFGHDNKDKRAGKSPDSYNLYKKPADFKNNYGWSIALDEDDYDPLKHSGIGVYLVNLTAGSMMAPHINPTATEYGIVLTGTGTVQIVYPNGTQAMNAKVSEGDVFWVPRYFPFCQIASRTGPFEFFGFTTSARKNRPQFLAGAKSIFQTLKGPELATAFGLSEDKVRRLVEAQREAVILPAAFAGPPEKVEKRLHNLIKGIGDEMIMGFD